MNDTWECLVWDGTTWLRFSDLRFPSPENALESASRIISAAVVYVWKTADIERLGMPQGEPPEMSRFPLDTVKQKG